MLWISEVNNYTQFSCKTEMVWPVMLTQAHNLTLKMASFGHILSIMALSTNEIFPNLSNGIKQRFMSSKAEALITVRLLISLTVVSYSKGATPGRTATSTKNALHSVL